MENKYKCEMCGSVSDKPGTCDCGGERKPVDSKMDKMEHNHKEGATCPVCSAK